MKRLLNYLEKVRLQLSLPLLLSSILIAVVNIIAYFPVDELSQVKSTLIDSINLILGSLFCSYIVYESTDKFDKAMCSLFVFIVSDMVCYATTSNHFSLVFILLITFLLCKVFKLFDLVYAAGVGLFFGIVLSLIISVIYPLYFDLLKQFALLFAQRPTLFNAVNNIFILFVSNDFEQLIFDTGIGSSIYVNDKLVVGIKSVFLQTVNNPNQTATSFLSGKYFVNIFVSIGLLLDVFSKLDFKQKATLTVLTLISIIFGENVLLSFYILLLNPIAYFGYLLLILISFTVSNLLDIRLGYIEQGSLLELINYSDKIVYFLISGLILCVLSYFIFKIIFVKFDSSNNMFLSKDSRRILQALGGRKNIEKLDDDFVLVKNPNLINILKLDCEIYSNKVILLQNDYELLKQII